MKIMFYFSVLFSFLCLLIHFCLYIGLFFFNEYFIFFSITCNIINALIIILFLIVVRGMILDGINRPAMLNISSEYIGFKREFPHTNLRKAKNILNITGFYFFLSIASIFFLGYIRNNPDYVNGKYILEKIYEIIQNESKEWTYTNRILSSAWWFNFLGIILIYFNDRRKR